MQFLRLIKEVHLKELKCLIAAAMITLHALDRSCCIVGLNDCVALLALDLKANFVSHVYCPIFPNGLRIHQRAGIAPDGSWTIDEPV